MNRRNLGQHTKICVDTDAGVDLLSWNINDVKDSVLGRKTIHPQFVEQLHDQRIFCFQETKAEIKIPNYKCYNKLRSDSRSGGLCIGVHREYDHLVEPVDTSQFSDLMAVRLCKEFLDGNEAVILVNVYDSPENSSYKARKRKQGHLKETLEDLGCFLSSLKWGTPYIVVGDMNARTGNLSEPSVSNNDLLDELIDGSFQCKSHNMTSTRNSEDETINERGRKLLDLASEADLKILNGSTVGDIFGRYTCLHYNGSSVVDYAMVSNCIMNSIDHFRVLDFTNFSDHRPITFRLRCNRTIKTCKPDVRFTDPPSKYLWDPATSPIAFQAAQSDPDFVRQCQDVRSQTCNSKEDAKEINNRLVELLSNAARKSLEPKRLLTTTTKRKSTRKPRKNPWFDSECIKSRIELRKACRNYCKSPTNEELRQFYYNNRKMHRRLIKAKKANHFSKLNKEIEENNNIKWDQFKTLKAQQSSNSDDMDLYDLANFYKFFKELYAEQTLGPELVAHLQDETASLQCREISEEVDEILNGEITLEELSKMIAKLKKGKAAAEDGILNEFLKHSTYETKLVILKVYNECLEKGIYPWNTALITPLHKKGDKADPNNYRAIAVGSNLGKLFSGILLERLITFRNTKCPDTTNQLGFVKDAQTNDHVFTLSTCVEKYTKNKKRLYTCFVDYRKAFDTVCREALLYKLSNLGIKGNFFRCVQHMYQNSSAKLKLLSKISEAIEILVGTEQGHPMSLELFKIYLLDLSIDLNDMIGLNLPELNGVMISHLLWADDLVLLALDAKSLQTLINRVYHFCEEWGLSVNISKTAIMVFNKASRQLQESLQFKYGSTRNNKNPICKDVLLSWHSVQPQRVILSGYRRAEKKGTKSLFRTKIPHPA